MDLTCEFEIYEINQLNLDCSLHRKLQSEKGVSTWGRNLKRFPQTTAQSWKVISMLEVSLPLGTAQVTNGNVGDRLRTKYFSNREQ